MYRELHSLFASTLLVVGVVSGPAVAAEIVLVQDEAYPPYMLKEGADASGIWADVVKEAGRRMDGMSFKLDAVPWSRAVGLVEKGRAHGLVGTYYKPEARPWIATYSEPAMTEQVSVYCHPGVAKADWTYPDDYKGLTFGNNTGFQTPGAKFFAMVEAGDITLQEAPSTEQNLKKLSAGRIDCYVQERLSAEIAINSGGIDNVERVTDASSEESFIGYTDTWTGPEAEAFIAAMDKAIKEMKADGTIDKIIKNYVGG
ncbi:ABC transporter substrate-binding protein [Labrenzia sp. VG12]|uniref:substrate-binding periplasmic protein n=1 Tax=Labrenzia sp. VG12 TaxID=2021862 RepID=UPI000B8C6BB9|nr:transporter substrate-binding domain-containing protein [Labrenzia sp. VG12]ASP34054.1 hypothetical protein CHH27_13040 [Labrenzia sp. VG12]